MASRPSNPPRVLIADDEPGLREVLSVTFSRLGLQATVMPGARAAIEALSQSPQPFSLVVTDLVMPDGSGLDVLRAAKARTAATEVIVITAHSTLEAAIDAMHHGAYDFVAKPFSPAELSAIAQKALEKVALISENQRLRAAAPPADPMRELLGTSAQMAPVLELVDKIAKMKTTVLITGASGTGKECVARLLHEKSDRAQGPFLAINVGALPEHLIESELFGHEKGAFTGATNKSPGLFRQADGGTLLLDEVGELPLALQVKLLRVLQDRKVRPVGGTEEAPVDVRVLAATNRDIESEIRAGRFREDLYYRLNVIRIELPALAKRDGEAMRLADKFVRRFAQELGKDVRGLSPDALRAIDAYPFPGNVRELENMMERAVALASGLMIGLGDLPASVSGLAASPSPMLASLPEAGCVLDDVLGELERRLILQALERTGGVRKPAAKLLGLTFRSLRYRMAKLGLAPSDELDSADTEDP